MDRAGKAGQHSRSAARDGAPPSTEPAEPRPRHGVCHAPGHWSLRATKYRKAGKAPAKQAGRFRELERFLVLYPSWNAPPGPTELRPRTPRTLLGWSPPQARFQETAPDAGSRVEPHWAERRLRQAGTTGRPARGEIPGGLWGEPGAGASMGKSPAACVDLAAPGNLRRQNDRQPPLPCHGLLQTPN